MTQSTHLAITAPLALARTRVPVSLMAGTSAVRLDRPDESALEWRWTTAGATGTVMLSALTPDTTALVVTEGPGSTAGIADALTVELCGALERTWAPSVPTSQRLPVRRSRKIALAVAALLIPVLAVTGMRVLAPPKPMDVASAVEQFRQQSATPAPAAPADRPATGDQAATATKARNTEAARPTGGGTDEASDSDVDQQAASAGAAPDAPKRQSSDTSSSAKTSADQGGRSTERQPAPRQGSAAPEPSGVPDEGVYRYATQGYESIDRPSSRHDYPSETALSVRHTDCGFTARWQPLENRWDEMDVCRRGGASFLPRVSTHREFYGQENDSDYQCGADNYAYRPEPGATWTGSCSDGPAKMQIRGTTLGVEPVRVGNQTVKTVHYTIESRISGGDAEGNWRADRWVDPDTGILVRVEAETNATSDSSVGEVNYHEELSLRLLSMTPQR